MKLTYKIERSSDLEAGIRGYTDTVTVTLADGDPGGDPGEFEAHIQAALEEWFDGATIYRGEDEK